MRAEQAIRDVQLGVEQGAELVHLAELVLQIVRFGQVHVCLSQGISRHDDLCIVDRLRKSPGGPQAFRVEGGVCLGFLRDPRGGEGVVEGPAGGVDAVAQEPGVEQHVGTLRGLGDVVREADSKAGTPLVLDLGLDVVLCVVVVDQAGEHTPNDVYFVCVQRPIVHGGDRMASFRHSQVRSDYSGRLARGRRVTQA
ncbi:hypothetical protein [Jiangella sp. DSM 45060]|uniref:hypothetical protein n=1 Tax=Jiangella sp. DSM 45060 TaxID=1798224 RepID=UPI0012FDF6C7|nr:hypothetical protein [Jiangella sp. DSM 45060]